MERDMQRDLFGAIEKEEFMKKLREGETADCPYCGRHSQIYKRKIHKTIAVILIKLYRAGGDKDFLHFTDFAILRAGGEFALAKHWGLILGATHEPEEKKTSGKWMLTKEGVDFVMNRTSIKKYALVFDDRCIDLYGEDVTIKDCLGETFNYSELMHGV
jgi:hypothetical protein